jgi:hypothetical protein
MLQYELSIARLHASLVVIMQILSAPACDAVEVKAKYPLPGIHPTSTSKQKRYIFCRIPIALSGRLDNLSSSYATIRYDIVVRRRHEGRVGRFIFVKVIMGG